MCPGGDLDDLAIIYLRHRLTARCPTGTCRDHRLYQFMRDMHPGLEYPDS